MKRNSGWYRPSWANLYYSKAVYEFLWKTDECFHDATICILKRKIRNVMRELLIFFTAFVFTLSVLIWRSFFEP